MLGAVPVNYRLLHAINGLSGHSQLADDLMVFCAKDLIYLVFVGLAFAALPFLRDRRWAVLAQAAGSLALAFALGLVASLLVPEQRPFTTHPSLHVLTPHDPGLSFPSDHATAAFAIAFLLLAYTARRWAALALAAAALIGFARVYAGVHYPGDIAGSALIAALAVGGIVLASRRLGHPSIPRSPQRVG